MATPDREAPGEPPATWDGDLYAANTAHHRAYDGHVLGPVPFERDWHVLDVGCGVGDLTAAVATMVPEGRVLGVDASAAQLEVARRRHAAANLDFAAADARSLSTVVDEGFAAPGSFDLVLSVAALHWVAALDHPRVFGGMLAVLGPGGTLRLEFGGEGQIADTRAVLDRVSAEFGGPASPWNFPAPEVTAAQLAAAGFDLTAGWVRLVEQRRSVPDEAAFTGWIDSQVLNAYLAAVHDDDRSAFRAAALDACRVELRRADGSYDQRYVRIDVLARAPEG